MSHFRKGDATVRIGTRGSALALHQAALVRIALERTFPALTVETITVRTSGDKIRSPLSEKGGKGLFVKEIEEALLRGRVDVAVHSLKDMPAALPRGLTLAGVLRRADPRDALISRSGKRLRHLPPCPRIGTGSPRRAALLKNIRPDANVLPLRGNVPTRLAKLSPPNPSRGTARPDTAKAVSRILALRDCAPTRNGTALDAIVLACAGLERLGFAERITEKFSVRAFVPAPGQGIVVMECRQRDRTLRRMLQTITHGTSWTEARAERAFLKTIGGNCLLPLGALARRRGRRLTMRAFLETPDGALGWATLTGSARGRDFPERLGRTLVLKLLKSVKGSR